MVMCLSAKTSQSNGRIYLLIINLLPSSEYCSLSVSRSLPSNGSTRYNIIIRPTPRSSKQLRFSDRIRVRIPRPFPLVLTPTFGHPNDICRYSDEAMAGQSGKQSSFPGRGEFCSSSPNPDRFWSLHSFLSSRYRWLPPGDQCVG
jgi:hypothetical protein